MGRFITIVVACSALALSACGHYGPKAPHAGDGLPPAAQGRGSGPMGMVGQMGQVDHQGPMHGQMHENMHEKMHEQMNGRMHGAIQGPGGPGPMRGLGALNPMGAMQPGTMGQLGIAGLMFGLESLGLSAEQRARIDEIRNDARQRGLEILRAAQAPGEAPAAPPPPLEEPVDRGAYDAMAAAHRQVFELHLEARKRILEVLTPEQREHLGRLRRGG
jgi:Spy/CpxP family protein refolding chaperone